ncbi:MAG: alpha/beta hydrolase [Rhodobiaceae bacterium]|nr:alpha/beta hydrolase [Rhodobiaceae bacterium]
MRLWVAAIFFLVGCAPQTLTVGTPVRQAVLGSDSLIMDDAARLPVRAWRAEKPRAIILGVHGFNDYSRAFDMPGPWFADRGITFYAYDQRGFGKAPAHGKWAGADILTDDLRTAIALLKDRHPHTPLFVLGTSMGGAVTLAAIGEGSLPVDGVVLVAPAVWGWSTLNPLYRSTLWLAAHTAPAYTLTGEGLERWPSDNIDMLRALSRDPLVIKETRIDAIYGLVDLMEKAYLSIEHIAPPALLLYGDKDEIVPRGPVDDIRRRFRNALTTRDYPDGWHMLLRDLQREDVWQDIDSWISDLGGGAVPD